MAGVMRTLVRWLGRRVDWHDQRGGIFAGLGALSLSTVTALIVLGVGGIVVIAGQDIYDVATGKWNPKPQTAAAGAGAGSRVFVGPELKGDTTQRDCIVRAFGRHGLVYGSYGWEAPGTYEIPPDGSRQGAFDVYRDQVGGLAQQFIDEYNTCLTTLPRPSEETTTSSLPLAINGTYTVTIGGGGAAHLPCQEDSAVNSLRITNTPDSLTIVLVYNTRSDQVTGSGLSSLGGFSTHGLRDIGGGLGIDVTGVFDMDGNDTVIRNGEMTFHGPDGPCSQDFTAKKQ